MAETQLLDYGFALDDGAGLQLTGYGFYYSAASGGTAYSRTISESASVADSPIKHADFSHLIGENFSLSDYVDRCIKINRATIDQAEASDPINKIAKYYHIIVDDINVVDIISVIVSGVTNYFRTIIEAIAAQDIASKSVEFRHAIAEFIDTTERLDSIRLNSRTLSDYIDSVDSLAKSVILLKQISENISIDDQISVTLQLASIQIVKAILAIESAVVRIAKLNSSNIKADL